MRKGFKIITNIMDLDSDPSQRQRLVPGWRQKLIESSRVLVVGVGALGNEVIKNLVLLGVGFIRVVDFDYVVHSNLNRCILFTKEDADRKASKVEAVARRAREIDPYGYVKIDPINTNIMKHDYTSSIYKDINIVFTALDNLEARLYVNNQAYYLGIPLIDGGMDGAMGHIQVVVPPYTSCLYCSVTSRDLKILSERLKCDGLPNTLGQPKMPAIITTTSIVAGLMVHEYVKVIHGIERFRKEGKWDEKIGEPLAGKRLFFNLSIPKFVVYDVPINSNCPLHDHSSREADTYDSLYT